MPMIIAEKSHAAGVAKQTPIYDSLLVGLLGLINVGKIAQTAILAINSPIPLINGNIVF